MPFEILVWADNIFLVSSSITDIVKRTQEIAYVFGKRGLRFNQSVLGCYLDGSGSTETQVEGRLGQGRKMFGKLRPLLCCPRIPEEERIKTFYTKVASSVLWGSGCWIPSTKTQQLVSIQETRWLRCMLGGRKAQHVPWVDWFRATTHSAQPLRCKLNLPSLWHRMGRTRGSERFLPSWACCNAMAKR